MRKKDYLNVIPVIQAKKFLMGQGVSGQKITSQIPHGIDPEVFYYDPDIEEENYIFSPSRLVFSKGVDVLLKAFAIALKRVGTMSLIIQGDGPGAEEYKELSKKLNIRPKIRPLFCIYAESSWMWRQDRDRNLLKKTDVQLFTKSRLQLAFPSFVCYKGPVQETRSFDSN